MSAKKVFTRISKNAATMANTLPSSESTKRDDNCCGIHGAARKRKGIKSGTSSARRRFEKQLIENEMSEYEETANEDVISFEFEYNNLC